MHDFYLSINFALTGDFISVVNLESDFIQSVIMNMKKQKCEHSIE